MSFSWERAESPIIVMPYLPNETFLAKSTQYKSLKPRRMHEGYGSRFVCLVYLCVCYHASSYIPGLYVQSEVAYSFL